MLELLKEQFENGKVLTANKNFGPLKRDLWAKYYWDMYPLAQEYYHELNPYFLFNLYLGEFFKVYKMFTVRDGMVNFANFIMTHFNTLPKLGTKLFLIHPDLVPLIPPHLKDYFACWHMVRPNAMKISDAKKIVIFGFACEQYLENVDEIPERLSVLKNLRDDVEIELYIPSRKNVFELQQKESVINYQILTHIHNFFPGKKFKFLTSEHFTEKSDMKGTYLLDLAPDTFMVADNYVHYFVHSRGGTVHGVQTNAPKDSVFSVELSFNHQLHVTPLPQTKSVFAELLFYKKQNPGKDYVFDPVFQSLVRDGLRKES